jgi:sterol desaturase/sphingolipid hydroxylase (fatty acid hydroxylase superfamily)
MLVELIWPVFNPLVVTPVLAAVAYVVITGLLQPLGATQIFAAQIATLSVPLQFLIALLLIDFTTYVRHRFVHIFCWPYHLIHHAATEIHWTTTGRLHPGDTIVMGVIQILIGTTLGFEAPAAASAALVYAMCNFMNHLNINADWGWGLRYVFVSPNMHRWHHAADDGQAQDKNFAVVFAFWDLLFGSFYVPRNRLPGAYGVWDEQGRDVVSERFFDQLIYPFRHHWLWLHERFGSRK